jgi:ribulose-phosphate 3-epimerase
MKISASIQAANQLKLLSDIETNSEKFDQLHIDITDGHFTENIGLSIDIVKLLKVNTDYFLDVHLMLNNNFKFVEKVFNNGADLVTVHCESTSVSEFQLLTERFENVGIGILPTTKIETLIPFLHFAKAILLLTVNPGFSNQPKAVNLSDRLSELRKLSSQNNKKIIVDGGVTNDDLPFLKEMGVDIAVQGGAIFGK